MAKFSDAINHVKCFSFRGGVVLFGRGEPSASVIDRTIQVRRCFLHQCASDGYVGSIHKHVE